MPTANNVQTAFKDYFNLIKPYHTKLLDVLEIYNFSDAVNVLLSDNANFSINLQNKAVCSPVGFGVEFDQCGGYSTMQSCDLFACVGGYGVIFDNAGLTSSAAITNINADGSIVLNGNVTYDKRFQISNYQSSSSLYIKGDQTSYFQSVSQPLVFIIPYNTYNIISNDNFTITLSGNLVTQFNQVQEFIIYNGGPNDGIWYILGTSYNPVSNTTVITVDTHFQQLQTGITNQFVQIAQNVPSYNDGLYQVSSVSFNGTNTLITFNTSVKQIDYPNAAPGSLMIRTAFIENRIVVPTQLVSGVPTTSNCEYRINNSVYNYQTNTTTVYLTSPLSTDIVSNYSNYYLGLYGYLTGPGLDGMAICPIPPDANVNTFLYDDLKIIVNVTYPTPTPSITPSSSYSILGSTAQNITLLNGVQPAALTSRIDKATIPTGGASDSLTIGLSRVDDFNKVDIVQSSQTSYQIPSKIKSGYAYDVVPHFASGGYSLIGDVPYQFWIVSTQPVTILSANYPATQSSINVSNTTPEVYTNSVTYDQYNQLLYAINSPNIDVFTMSAGAYVPTITSIPFYDNSGLLTGLTSTQNTMMAFPTGDILIVSDQTLWIFKPELIDAPTISAVIFNLYTSYVNPNSSLSGGVTLLATDKSTTSIPFIFAVEGSGTAPTTIYSYNPYTATIENLLELNPNTMVDTTNNYIFTAEPSTASPPTFTLNAYQYNNSSGQLDLITSYQDINSPVNLNAVQVLDYSEIRIFTFANEYYIFKNNSFIKQTNSYTFNNINTSSYSRGMVWAGNETLYDSLNDVPYILITPTAPLTRTPAPTPTLTTSITPTINSSPTATPAPSSVISPTPNFTPTATHTVTPTLFVAPQNPTPTPTISLTPSITFTPSITASNTITPTVTPSLYSTPTVTPSLTVFASLTPTPSVTPQPSENQYAIYSLSNNPLVFNPLNYASAPTNNSIFSAQSVPTYDMTNYSSSLFNYYSVYENVPVVATQGFGCLDNNNIYNVTSNTINYYVISYLKSSAYNAAYDINTSSNPTYTIEFGITSLFHGYNTPILYYGNSSTYNYYVSINANGYLVITFNSGTTPLTTTVAIGTSPTLIDITYDSTTNTLTIYANGVSSYSTTVSSIIATVNNTYNLFVGANNGVVTDYNNWNWLAGTNGGQVYILGLALYNKVLSQTVMSQNYTNWLAGT